MGESARIHDVESLKAARHALAEFAESAAAALATIDVEVQRISHWLNVERPTHWKLELRRREEAVERGKAEIMRKRIIAAPDPASVVLEERRLDRARERLEEARRRMEHVRRWAPIWDREAMLYKGSTRGLAVTLQADIPRALAVLGAMMESLEGYADVAPPPSPPDVPAPDAEMSTPMAVPPPPPPPPHPTIGDVRGAIRSAKDVEEARRSEASGHTDDSEQPT